ncbi:unnamed protein product [Calypogeia fissa]
MRHVVTEASLSTRAHQWWAGIPFVTAGLVAFCSGIYVVQLISGYDSFSQICFEPYLVLSRYQVYRLFTSVFVHASIFHVLFNMLALVPIGSALERVMGTVRFFHVILLLIVSNGVIHVGLAFLAAHNPIYPYADLSVECGVGFSGVIFALIVIETSLSGTQNRSIFGFFTVPAKLYPWALLFLFQLLMPSVSLLGHLSGILSGFLYTFGVYERALCGHSAYSAVENASALGCFVRRPGFIVGGSSASGNLPSISPARFSFSTGRFSGYIQRLRNAWSGMQAYAPIRETVVDERFPGRGRTLGSVSGPTPPQSTPDGRGRNLGSATGAPTQSSPDGRGRGRTVGSINGAPPTQSNPEGRDFNNNTQSPNSVTVEMQAVRPSPPVARQVNPGLSTPPPGYPTPNQIQNESPALQDLVAMGFEKTKAIHALAASNGDVTLAVEFLSAEGQ